MRSLISKSLVAFVVLFCALSLARAQDTSSLTGVVTDPTGAVIPGVVVTLTHSSTGASFTQTTDSLGFYHFLNVPPGQGYKATFTHAGFAVSVISEITLDVAVTRTQNVTLNVGAEAQTVGVSAVNQTVTLNTTDASIGNNIDVKQLNDLPV